MVATATYQMWKPTSRMTTWRAFSLQKQYIFSTEGHLLPVTPEIALVDEHCSYFGAFCNGSEGRRYGTSASSKHQNANYTQFDDSRTPSSQYSVSDILFTTRGYIKGVCPGLTCAQKLGISYSDEEGNIVEENSESHENPDESAVESSVQAHSNSLILISHPVASQPDEALKSRSSSQDHTNIVAPADSEPTETDYSGGSLGENTQGLTEVTESISIQTEDTDEGIVDCFRTSN